MPRPSVSKVRCEGAALSAEMGKALGDTLDVNVDSEMVTELLTPSEIGDNKGYLSASATTGKRTPQTGSTEYRRYSDPIPLKAGDVLYIKAATDSNVARLSKYVENATYDALMILQGTSSSSDINAGTTYETTYTAQEDFDALVGWNWKGDIEIKITRQENVATSKADMIEPIAEVLEFTSEATTKTSAIELTGSNGYYTGIDASLSGTTSNNYKHSDFVSLKAGDVLTIDVKNVATSVKVLVRKEDDKVRGLVNGTNNTQQITYTVPYDAQYAFSWLNSTGITVTKTTTINGSSARLDAIEENAASKEDVEDLGDAVFNVVTDGLTTGLVEGKFISHDGSVATNESYAYKEITVKAGAVINFTATMHPNLAAIAKKIPHINLYEELVPATQHAVQSFTYSATEEMIIAVSFANESNATHTITILTTLPTSNRLNIENIYDKIDVKHHVDFGRMFDKIAVIGDSLASGRVEGIVGEPDAVGADYYHFSWLAFLAKRWHCEAYKNYSNAGATTASWLQNWLSVMQADATVYDAYFIALGTNNEYNESSPSGTNYEAFVDRYNDIIDAVRTKAPHAVIFIMSLYGKRAGNATLEDIAETRMATDDGVFYLDYANEAEYFRYSPEVNWRGHFSSTGYVYVAEAINRLVNDVVWENKLEEFWQQFAKYHNGN